MCKQNDHLVLSLFPLKAIFKKTGVVGYTWGAVRDTEQFRGGNDNKRHNEGGGQGVMKSKTLLCVLSMFIYFC